MMYQAIQNRPSLSSTVRLFSNPDGYPKLDQLVCDAYRPLVRANASQVRDIVRGLKNRGWNWDERGSAAGSPLAIDRAVVLLDAHVFQVLGARNLAWNEPHVSLNEDGDVVFEWWNGEKKLTLYVGEKVTEYLSSWGPDIDQQMYAGELNGNLLQLWQWFLLPAEQ